jgi:PQQ-dependent dehydrogenase (s-GDH family)
MKLIFTLFPTLFIAFFPLFLNAQNENFSQRSIVCSLDQPWEVTYGPDAQLWVTESRGYRLIRVNPTTGATSTVLDAVNLKNFPATQFPWPQGGFTGLALHPQLLTGKPYVYLAYVYQFVGCPNNVNCLFKTKVVRYDYNATTNSVSNEMVIVDSIPGSDDHNGGRLTIGNVNGTPYLFYSVGDMGAGQFGNATRPHNSQNSNSYEGKILRFNLEPDGDAGAFDKWIPASNPFNAARQNAVWSIGHRNPQGLVMGTNGIMYETEHGPYSDDELNIISSGKNYGFPLIAGLADGNYNGIKVGTGPTVPFINSEQNNATALGANYQDPLKSFFPVTQATAATVYNNVLNGTDPVPNYFLSWPSIAPSGIDFYGSTAIPGWQNSILVASLKRATLYRLKLSANGQTVTSDTIGYFRGQGRMRDVAISPDGTKIYVACDFYGQTSGPTAGTALTPNNRGCILEFTYQPPLVCNLTNSTNNIVCNNNGTPDNSSDDTYTFDVNVISNGNCGSTWTTTVGANTVTGVYGTVKNFGPFPISSGNQSLTIRDVNNVTSTTNIFAVAPANCSQGSVACAGNLLINGGFEGVNGGAFAANWAFDAGIGTYVAGPNSGIVAMEFCTNNAARQTVGASAGKTYKLRAFTRKTGNANAQIAIKYLNGSFTPLAFQALPIGATAAWTSNEITLLAPTGTAYVEISFSLNGTGSCFDVDDFCLIETTTTPACIISASASNIVCNDAGTPTVTTDDTYTFDVTIQNTGACAASWTGDGTIGTYGVAKSFGPYLISGGNKTLTFNDLNNATATTSVTANAPAPCSTPINVTCVGNILQNPGFESGISAGGWNYNVAAEQVAVTHSGSNAVRLCTINTGRQTIVATAGKTYNVSFFAQKSGTGLTQYGIKFMNASFSPLDAVYPPITANTYTAYTNTRVAPAGTAYMEISFSNLSTTSCLYTDDWCVSEVGIANSVDLSFDVFTAASTIQNGATLTSGQSISLGIGYKAIATPAQAILHQLKVYLSSDNVADASDYLLASINQNVSGTPNLTAFSPILTAIMPQTIASGAYFIIAKVDADGQISESNENNNTGSVQITIQGQPPISCSNNLATNAGFENGLNSWSYLGVVPVIVGDFNTAASAVQMCTNNTLLQTKQIAAIAGTNYTLSAFAKKSGTGAAQMGLKFMSNNFTPLDAGYIVITGTSYQSYNISKITPTGTAYIEVSFNNFNANTCLTIDDVCLNSGAASGNMPDLSLSNFNTANSAASGTQVNFNVDIKNTGTAAVNGNYVVAVYLSTDNVLTANDPQIGLINTGGTPIGTISQVLSAFTLPNGTAIGNYFLITKIDRDNAIAESDENNNTISKAFTVSTGTGGNAPDLLLNFSNAPANPGQWGNVTMTLEVRNLGTVAANGVVVSLPKQSNSTFSAQLAYVSHTVTAGSFNYWDGAFTVGTVNPGQTVTLVYNAFTKVSTPISVFAQVTAQSPADLDSSPNNNTTSIPVEDDEALLTINRVTLAAGTVRDLAAIDATNITDFNLFPNPAGESVTLDLTPWEGKTAIVQFYNELGLLVKKHSILEVNALENIDLSDFQNGVYFVTLETKGQRRLTKKLVIARMY